MALPEVNTSANGHSKDNIWMETNTKKFNYFFKQKKFLRIFQFLKVRYACLKQLIL